MKKQTHQQLLVKKLFLFVLLSLCMTWLKAQTYVSGNQSGTWTKVNSPYVMTDDVVVPDSQTLVIQPGVEVRFNNRTYFNVNGTLRALGTSVDSVKFSGLYAGEYYGSTTGGPIIISQGPNDSTVLDYCAVIHLGCYSIFDNQTEKGVIKVVQGFFKITNSSISSSEPNMDAIHFITSTIKGPVIRNVDFSNGGNDVRIHPDNISNISNNVSGVFNLVGGTYSNKNISISKPGLNSYYVLENGTKCYFTNSKVTIQPGVEIRSAAYDNLWQIDGSGVLVAKGTVADSIIFRGFLNTGSSSHGGMVLLQSSNTVDTSILSYVVFDRMGDKDYYTNHQAALAMGGGINIVRNSTFRNCEKRGIFTSDLLDMNPIVSNVVFSNTPQSAVMYASNVSGFSNNTNAIVTLLSGTYIGVDVTIPKTGIGGYYNLETNDDGQYYFTDCKVTIKPGVEIRSPSFKNLFQVDGSAVLVAKGTVTDSIRFRGFSNIGFDINSTHGGLILIQSSNTVDSSVFAYVVIDKMGDKDYYTDRQAALDMRGGINIIRNSSIRNCELRGIVTTAVLDVNPIVSNVVFSNTPQSAAMYASNVSGFSNNTNAVVTLIGGTFSNQNVIIPKSGTGSYYKMDQDAGYYFVDSKVTILPGVEIRSSYYNNRFDISGSGVLVAKGNSTDSIKFLGFSNTSFNTSSTHGGVVALYSSNTTDSSVFSYVVFDRMGDVTNDNYGAIQISSGKVAITNSSIRNSESWGIYGRDASGLSVRKTDIFKNKYGADFLAGSPVFKNCNIYNNSIYGILNESTDTLDIVDARTCWWGAVNGPKQTTTNPSGTGNPVSLQVLYKPFLTSAYVDVAVKDIGIDSIVTPFPNCSLTVNEAVKIKIRNYGNVPQTGFNVSYRLNNGAVVAQNVGSLTIAGGDFAYFTFSTPANLGVGQGAIYTIQAYTSGLVSDTVRRNDTAKISFVNNKPYVGKDTLIKLCSKGSANLSTLYNTAGYSNATWSTARPDSVGKGIYTLIVTNVFGCRDTAVVTVDTISGSAITSTVSTTNAGCFGGVAGTIKVTPTNGKAPYMFKNGSAGAYQSANIFKPLSGGIYTIYIKDSNSCMGNTAPVIVTQYAKVTATFTKTDATCFNKADGTITLTASGGKPPYKYKLGNNGIYQDPSTFTGLKAGPYMVYIRDNAGCTGSVGFININQPPTPCLQKGETAVSGNKGTTSFSLSLSPNPSNNAFILQVHTDHAKPIQVRVLDVNGKVLYTAKGQPEQPFRFGGEFVSGVYLVEVMQGDVVRTVKAVKVR